MKKFFLALIVFALSCNFLQPSYLLIKNESDYRIKVTCNKAENKNLILEKNKRDYFLIYPDNIDLIIYIYELDMVKNYRINMNYQEKKEFLFKVNCE